MARPQLVAVSLMAALVCFSVCFAEPRDNLGPLLTTLRQVDREGKGNRDARAAWAHLTTRANADDLPLILGSIDGAGPLAANWLRAAVDTIAERHVQRSGKLPLAGLEQFLADPKHDPRARRLAYEWIARNDSGAPERLIPKMLDDPSLELRRDAVARVLSAAEVAATNSKTDVAIAEYRKALDSARDLDQVKSITEALKKLGRAVDLPYHFGFVQDWNLLGPFDNAGGKGFDTTYQPETEIDLAKSYPISTGTIGWKPHHTDDENGYVDLNKAIGKQSGVVAYAFAEFVSTRAQGVELRLGSDNAIKVWLNGVALASSEVYHGNVVMDQYAGRGELKAGRNTILVKVCQNEQKEDWAQEWRFQLRVCDGTGKAILAANRPVPPAQAKTATQTSKE